VLDLIRKAPLLAALDEESAADLQRSMTQMQLRRGQVLFHEGAIGDRLYVIVEGKIKLAHSSGDGRQTLLSLFGPGEMFGELSLFDPDRRKATATAVTDSRLYALGHRDLERWLPQHPEVALPLLRRLSRRLRTSTEVVSDLVFHDTPGGWPSLCWSCRPGSAHPRTTVCASTTT
jgi:CRP-like cAMP-binding protein